MYDATGAETLDPTQTVKNYYLITVNQALSAASYTTKPSFIRTTAGNDVDVMFTKPSELRISSKPLSGKFTITCNLPGGPSETTADIAHNADYRAIKQAIENACPHFKDKLDIWEGPAY